MESQTLNWVEVACWRTTVSNAKYLSQFVTLAYQTLTGRYGNPSGSPAIYSPTMARTYSRTAEFLPRAMEENNRIRILEIAAEFAVDIYNCFDDGISIALAYTVACMIMSGAGYTSVVGSFEMQREFEERLKTRAPSELIDYLDQSWSRQSAYF